MNTLFRGVDLDGALRDVRVDGCRIADIGDDLRHTGVDHLVEAGGGALLPGLHDHHLHLLATAAARASVDCSRLEGLEALAGALRSAPGSGPRGWVRAAGYHDAVAGELERDLLDLLVPDRPVRVRYRDGRLWVLNSRALELVADVLDDSPDVERNRHTGEPTGRLRNYDSRLRPALPRVPPDLSILSRELACYGITSVTDASPELSSEAIGLLRGAGEQGQLRQHLTLLGDPQSSAPWTLLLHDEDLPSLEELSVSIRDTHTRRRPVAVHCRSREALLLALTALDEVGRRHGDRIDHATIVSRPTGLRGLRVVTQPGQILERGDELLRDSDPHDLPHLYPFARLIDAGIETVASSDSPFGPLDPWAIIRAARDRRTRSGQVLGPHERVPASAALAGYLTAADGEPRRVEVGAPADLCLLDVPLTTALASEDGVPVRGAWINGEPVPA